MKKARQSCAAPVRGSKSILINWLFPVAIRITWERAFDAVPRVARCVACLVPAAAALAPRAFVVLAQVAFDFVEATPLVTTVTLVPRLVRRLVIIPARVLINVIARRVIFSPVGVFSRWIDLFRDSFSRQAAD